MNETTPDQQKIEAYLHYFEVGKELSEKYQKYEGYMDWTAFVEYNRSRIPGFDDKLNNLITTARAEGYEKGRIKGYTDSTRDHLGTEADYFNKGMKQGYQKGVKAMQEAVKEKVVVDPQDGKIGDWFAQQIDESANQLLNQPNTTHE